MKIKNQTQKRKWKHEERGIKKDRNGRKQKGELRQDYLEEKERD